MVFGKKKSGRGSSAPKVRRHEDTELTTRSVSDTLLALCTAVLQKKTKDTLSPASKAAKKCTGDRAVELCAELERRCASAGYEAGKKIAGSFLSFVSRKQTKYEKRTIAIEILDDLLGQYAALRFGMSQLVLDFVKKLFTVEARLSLELLDQVNKKPVALGSEVSDNDNDNDDDDDFWENFDRKPLQVKMNGKTCAQALQSYLAKSKRENRKVAREPQERQFLMVVARAVYRWSAQFGQSFEAYESARKFLEANSQGHVIAAWREEKMAVIEKQKKKNEEQKKVLKFSRQVQKIVSSAEVDLNVLESGLQLLHFDPEFDAVAASAQSSKQFQIPEHRDYSSKAAEYGLGSGSYKLNLNIPPPASTSDEDLLNECKGRYHVALAYHLPSLQTAREKLLEMRNTLKELNKDTLDLIAKLLGIINPLFKKASQLCLKAQVLGITATLDDTKWRKQKKPSEDDDESDFEEVDI